MMTEFGENKGGPPSLLENLITYAVTLIFLVLVVWGFWRPAL
jgi:hypothetical protein